MTMAAAVSSHEVSMPSTRVDESTGRSGTDAQRDVDRFVGRRHVSSHSVEPSMARSICSRRTRKADFPMSWAH